MTSSAASSPGFLDWVRAKEEELFDMLPSWGVRLAAQLLVYLVLTVFAYFVIRTVRARPPADEDASLYARAARCCVMGYEPLTQAEVEQQVQAKRLKQKKVPGAEDGDGPSGGPERTPLMRFALLVYCTLGLMVAYIAWGIMQERIMSTTYGEAGRFDSSNFLVFSNRMFALAVAVPMILYKKEGLGRAPFYKYALTSLSNTISSWCQLEALKYVSFPVQTLAKSSKMVPVMIMGKVLSGKKYPWYEYGIAVVIGAGVTSFLLSQRNGGGGDDRTTQFSGVLLMLGYLASDSFTSQWQDVLFKEYGLSSYQMMFGVNAFSSLVTFASLVQSGELWASLGFLAQRSDALLHVCLFSIAGAIGQTFIFYTIKEFGPLVFTIISTVRQLLAIVLSVVIFGHQVAPEGMLGAVMVFVALLYRVWRKEQESKQAKEAAKRLKQGSEGDVEEAANLVKDEPPAGAATHTVNSSLNVDNTDKNSDLDPDEKKTFASGKQ